MSSVSTAGRFANLYLFAQTCVEPSCQFVDFRAAASLTCLVLLSFFDPQCSPDSSVSSFAPPVATSPSLAGNAAPDDEF